MVEVGIGGGKYKNFAVNNRYTVNVISVNYTNEHFQWSIGLD